MAIKDRDALADLIETDTTSERLIMFIWIAASQFNSRMADCNFLKLSRNDIARELKMDFKATDHIRRCLRSDLIPTLEFDWVTDNRRQVSWIKTISTTNTIKYSRAPSNGYIRSLHERERLVPYAIPQHLHGRNLSIAILDYWLSTPDSTLANRVHRVQQVRLDWDQQKRMDQRLDWFQKDDAKSRRTFFWEWMEKTDPEFTRNKAQFVSHEDLLIFFDDARFTEFHPIDLSERAKKIWNQRHRRERDAGKHQRNFVLTERTIANLEKLALKHGLTRTQIIENIINAEIEHGTYLNELSDPMGSNTKRQ